MPERADEARREADYPLSRWYLRPLAQSVAARLAPTRLRPVHVTVLGAALALTSAAWLAVAGPSMACALVVLAAWSCDRTDGALARRQRRASPRGAWLDANLDELADVAWHVAAGAWLARTTPWGWPLAVAFLSAKYLFFYGLQEPQSTAPTAEPQRESPPPDSLWRTLYHLPGNADVRLHLFAAAVALGWLGPELALVAAYYHLRGLARYALVWRRLPAASPAEASRAPAILAAQDASLLAEVSVALIVLDAEAHLRELLPTLTWAGEIVVVIDDRTTDASAAVAEMAGSRVVSRRFDNFAAQRNHAVALATRPWVLSLDADERPTAALLREIAARIRVSADVAFRVPISSRILGHAFRFSGTQDDRPIRIWRRGAARWQGAVHERLVVDGPIGALASPLEHDTLPTRAALREKIERYTDLAAVDSAARRRAIHAWSLPYYAAREFFRRWIWKQGFRDGPAGLEFCLWSAYSEWVLARKLLKRARQGVAWSQVPLGSDA